MTKCYKCKKERQVSKMGFGGVTINGKPCCAECWKLENLKEKKLAVQKEMNARMGK